MNAYTTIVAAPAPGDATTPAPATQANQHTVRHDGWTPERRRAFLEYVADGMSVANACRELGMSETSAYALRRRAAGAEFALGWQAANLLARDRFAEALTDRALEGYEETVTRADGTTVTRRRFDNRLAHAMLTRLDRYADQAEAKGSMRTARLIAGDFDAFLDLVEAGAGGAQAGLFLARRGLDGAIDPDLATLAALARADRYHRTGAGAAAEVRIDDLDPATRVGWTAEQWQRAEAAGLLTLAAPDSLIPDENEDASDTEDTELARCEMRVWNDDDGRWITDLPPPPGFTGDEDGVFGDDDYARDLSPLEMTILQAEIVDDRADQRARDIAAYPRIFGMAFPQEDAGNGAGQTAFDNISAPASPPSAASGVEAGPPPSRRIPMADTSHDIATLNSLIATTLDSVDGYTEAAKDADSDRFGSMFTARAEERRKCATAMQTEVTRQGGNPEDDGTALAGAHRVFLDLKSAVTGKDDKAIVNEVERGEDHIKAKFEDALQDTALSPQTRDVIQHAWTSVKQGHDQMRDLKHAMENHG